MALHKVFKIWTSCAKATTHHGLGHASNAKLDSLKFFWWLALLSAYAVFAFHLITLIQRYNEHPVSSRIQHGSVRFEFPDVTICNLMPFSLRMAEINNLSIVNLNAEEIRQLSEEAVLSVDDFIVECTYNETSCQIDKDFVQIDEVTYRHCFTFRPKNRTATTTTPKSGLNLILFGDNQHTHQITKLNLTSTAFESAGVRVAIHEPFTHPHPAVRGFDVSTGSYAKIAIQAEQIVLWPTKDSTTSQVKCSSERMEVSYCNPDSKLRFNYSGVQEDCETYRLQSEIYSTCNCVSSRYEVPATFCDNPLIRHCTTSPERICEMKEIRALNAGYLDVMRNCTPACEKHIWSYRLSLSTWPAHMAEDRIVGLVKRKHRDVLKHKNVSALDEMAKATMDDLEKYDMLAKNLVRLTVYPESLSGSKIVEDETYPLTSLLGEIGGILGLYLGCSVLTFFELFPTIARLIAALFHRHKRRRPEDVEAEPVDSIYIPKS